MSCCFEYICSLFTGRKAVTNVFIKGHLLWKIHFYVVLEHKCVLTVCEQNHPRMIKIHPVFFFYNLNKSSALSQRNKERWLARNPAQAAAYQGEMNNLEEAGYAQMIPPDQMDQAEELYYIFHQMTQNNSKKSCLKLFIPTWR